MISLVDVDLPAKVNIYSSSNIKHQTSNINHQTHARLNQGQFTRELHDTNSLNT
jgi:hypothetical protein